MCCVVMSVCVDDDDDVFAEKLLARYCCYHLMPNSCKLILFDSRLEVLSLWPCHTTPRPRPWPCDLGLDLVALTFHLCGLVNIIVCLSICREGLVTLRAQASHFTRDPPSLPPSIPFLLSLLSPFHSLYPAL